MQLSRMAASSGPFGANSKKGFMGEDEGKILMNISYGASADFLDPEHPLKYHCNNVIVCSSFST